MTWLRRNRASAPRRMRIEEIEPRILYSADFAPGLLDHAGEQFPQPEYRVVDANGEVAQRQPAPMQADTQRRELVLVESNTPDYQKLVGDILKQAGQARDIDVVVLDASTDGIAQISEILSQRQDLSAVHLISHGADGQVQLGTSSLNFATLLKNAGAIKGWARAFSADGDLLVYGCDVAQHEDGKALIDALSRLTGADVAASEGPTGSAALGADWNLEYATGSIEAASAIDARMQQAWGGILAISVDTTSCAATSSAGASSLTFAHTVSNGSNGILLVRVSSHAGTAVSSVTYGGAALTFAGSAQNPVGSNVRTEMWYLTTPAAGTANVVVTLAASDTATAGATTFFGVDQTTPLGTLASATGAGNAPSVTLTSAPGEVVVDALSGRGATSGTAGSGQTETYRQFTGNTGSDSWGASSTQAGATSVTMSWSVTGAGAGEWATIAVPLKPCPNTAPTLDTSASPMFTAQNEDSGAPSGAVGTLISSLVDFATPSGQLDNATDPDPGARLGMAVTAADAIAGSWWYSTNDGSSWNALGSVSDAFARLLAADSGTRLYFQPNADYNGTITNAITFRAWDQTSGSNGGTAVLGGTVLDTFASASYSNDDGTASWSTPWVESDTSAGAAAGGMIMVSGGQLRIQSSSAGDNVYREVDLAGATTARLSFDFTSTLAGSDTIQLRVSDNGGASYTVLDSFSAGQNAGSGMRAYDLSAYAASNTRIQFYVSSYSSSTPLCVDNVRVVAVWGGAAGGTSAFSIASDTASLTVAPVNDAPVLGNNTLAVTRGSSVVLGAAQLSASDVDNAASGLLFGVTGVSHGQFEQVSTPGVAIVSFTQAQIASGQIRFVHDGSNNAPALRVSVSDGSVTVGPYAASVSLLVPPGPAAPPLAAPPGLGLPASLPVAPTPKLALALATPVLPSQVGAEHPAASGSGGLVDTALEIAGPALPTDQTQSAVSARTALGPQWPSLLIALFDGHAGGPREGGQHSVIQPTLAPAVTAGAPTPVYWQSGFALDPLQFQPRLSKEWRMGTAFAGERDRAQPEGVRELQALLELSRLGGIALSVGTVAWVLRATAAAGRLAVSIPAWRHLDPVPVLATEQLDDRSDDDLPTDTGAVADELGVDDVLGGAAQHRSRT